MERLATKRVTSTVCPSWARRTLLLVLTVAAGVLACSLPALRAQAQANAVPNRSYFVALHALYSGELLDAERAFRNGANGAIQIGQIRWIDSICYYAGHGEVLYQLGRNAEALAAFDQSCRLFLEYSDWMQRIRFQQPPRPDPNRSRNLPPWGPSQRQMALAELPETMLVFYGQMVDIEAIRRGGIIEIPQFWQVHVQEVVRSTALAIRRRNQILGPLGRHDAISKELVQVLSRGGVTQQNHWSGAWADLLAGIAQAGVGDVVQAQTHLSRALLLEGRYDHALTSVALLEQGRLTMQGGNAAAAERLLLEASRLAYVYENWDVVREALRLGHRIVAASGAGVYPPLQPASAWARTNGIHFLANSFLLDRAESAVFGGQIDQAQALLGESGRRFNEMARGRPGVQQLYLQALVAEAQGRGDLADDRITQAIARQRETSLQNFQIARTNQMYDGGPAGRITSRVAVDLYGELLDDPQPTDWAQRPLDSLALMSLGHEGSFGRWFRAALDRRDASLAFEVAERTKRRRFHSALPLGGRSLALSVILESPPGELDNSARLLREQLLDSSPAYAEQVAEEARLRGEIRKLPLFPTDSVERANWAKLLRQWSETATLREALLRRLSLGRQPTPMVFPPQITTEELQDRLEPEEVVIAFHESAGQLFGMIITSGDEHAWQIGPVTRVRGQVSELLRAIGNFGPNRALSGKDLADDTWKQIATELFDFVLGESRLALDATSRVAIVPDGVLWYLPFEALLSPASDPGESPVRLADVVSTRYAPTASLAVRRQRPLRRAVYNGIVPSSATGSGQQLTPDAMSRLQTASGEAVILGLPFPDLGPPAAALLDNLVVFAERELDSDDPFNLPLLPTERRRGPTGPWYSLPWGGPERIVLANLSTPASSGLRASRRSRSSLGEGREMFYATLALLVRGTRTALLSRWPTGGEAEQVLIREFLQELPHQSADEAWQRSMLIARGLPLDPSREPRLEIAAGDPVDALRAEHPLFWAGHLLIDGGAEPAVAPQDEAGPMMRIGNADRAPTAAADAAGETAAEGAEAVPSRPAEAAVRPQPPSETDRSDAAASILDLLPALESLPAEPSGDDAER